MKCVYFEPPHESDSGLGEGSSQEHEGVSALKKFVKSNLKYGSSGMRDQRLEMTNQSVGSHTGTLHFIKFATSRMDGFF